MLENISLSFQGIWSHKMRSFLTMLGIIIGIASIITIVSTIKGTNEQIKQNLIGSGNNVVEVRLMQGDYTADLAYSSLPEGVSPITEETRAEIDELEGVEETSLYTSREGVDGVYYQNTSFSGNVYGIDSHYLSVYGYQVISGRGFTDEDFSQRRKVLLINQKTAQSLFSGADPVGKTIEIKSEPFIIVGVIAAKTTSSPKISSISDYYMYADTSSGSIYLPSSAWPIVFQYDEPQNAAVRADSTDNMTIAGNAAAQLLTQTQIASSGYQDSYDESYDESYETSDSDASADISVSDDSSEDSYSYKADNLLEQASSLQSLSESTNSQLIWIAGISLLVGGIGVMNIMLVSVTERTREIGLKKALGARRKRILGQFLTEAAVLTSLGGILGVACGIGLAQLMSSIMGTPVGISIPACVIAVAFSMAIGIIFGLVPAVKASRLNPIEALRYE